MTNTTLSAPVISAASGLAPVSKIRRQRLQILHAGMVVIGLLPWLLDASPSVRSAGLGLLFPGAGFIAVGGWALLLVPFTLLLFAVAVFAWFATGIIVAPPLVWLLASVAAGAMTREPGWTHAPLLALAALAAWWIRGRAKARRRHKEEVEKRTNRNAYLPAAMAAVAERAVPMPAPDAHELSAVDVALSRLMFNRALQPVGQLEGFNKIDQFQTAALRYQINFLGYGLAQMQSQYTPNFHGYLSEAQRRLIDQYLQRPIWDYWRLENLWGHLRYDPNPVGKSNIMLTAYLAQQVGMYMLTTGDRRYAEPGSLTFRWNAKTAYAHDMGSLHRSLMSNFEASPFCLFPCEPHWIYSGCNFFGLRAVAVHDRLFGGSDLEAIRAPFLRYFEREFTKASGSVVSLRSSIGGFSAPFPGGDAGAVQAMNLLSPELARRYWAMARNDMLPLIRDRDGVRRFQLPGKGLDFGNYGRGFTMIYGGLLMHAREIGDPDFSEALLNALDLDCGATTTNGVLSYSGSNMASATAFLGRMMQRDGYRQSLMVGPPAEALAGPILTGASYPEVLVAKARSHGEDLELVLYPGTGDGVRSIAIERLQPDRVYAVSGGTEPVVRADGRGHARLDVHLRGRTPVHLTPR